MPRPASPCTGAAATGRSSPTEAEACTRSWPPSRAPSATHSGGPDVAACSNGNPLADAITGFFSFLGDPVGTVIGLIAKSILAAAIAVFAGLADSVPTLDDTTTSNDLSDKTSWIVVYLAVGSLLFAAGKMALERRGTAGVTAL